MLSSLFLFQAISWAALKVYIYSINSYNNSHKELLFW